MSYILLSTFFFLLVLVAIATYTRDHWLPLLPDQVHDILDRINLPRIPFVSGATDYIYDRLPSTFAGDAEAGLSSSTFDLSGNVDDGDSRAGLDDEAKREILKIMKRRRMKFDDARRVYMERSFRNNGIAADGRPRDPKFVSFS